jgi:hypothetical protein
MFSIHYIITSLPIPNNVKIEEPFDDIERIHQFDKGLVIDNGKLRGHLRFCQKVVMIVTFEEIQVLTTSPAIDASI